MSDELMYNEPVPGRPVPNRKAPFTLRRTSYSLNPATIEYLIDRGRRTHQEALGLAWKEKILDAIDCHEDLDQVLREIVWNM